MRALGLDSWPCSPVVIVGLGRSFLERIVDAHKRNSEAVKQPKSCGKGYLGQVLNVKCRLDDGIN